MTDVLTEAAGTGKAIALVVDAAYIDFAGDEEKCREFLPKLETMPENVLPMVAYSLSKTYHPLRHEVRSSYMHGKDEEHSR